MQGKSKLTKGFTLVEMAVVIGVVGIIVAISMPAFSNFLRSHRVAGASNELLGDIHYARSMAVMQRQVMRIEFTSTEYKVVEAASSAVVRTRTLPPGVNLTSSADPSFYPWGLTDPVTITIAGGTNTKNLSLSPTGHVSRY